MCQSCKKVQSTLNVHPELNFMINVHNLSDTILIFNDTETYKIATHVTGEGRCPNIDCSACQNLSGQCKATLYIYNKAGDSIAIQNSADGCMTDLSKNLTIINLEKEVNPNFHFQIGLFKISPYPDLNNYQNPDSVIDFHKYICTYIVKK